MKTTAKLILVSLLAACSASNTSQQAATGLPEGDHHYLNVTNKDSSFFDLKVKGGEVTGAYRFSPEVSDGAIGQLVAQQHDQKIEGTLSLSSEEGGFKQPVLLEMQGENLLWKRGDDGSESLLFIRK